MMLMHKKIYPLVATTIQLYAGLTLIDAICKLEKKRRR